MTNDLFEAVVRAAGRLLREISRDEANGVSFDVFEAQEKLRVAITRFRMRSHPYTMHFADFETYTKAKAAVSGKETP